MIFEIFLVLGFVGFLGFIGSKYLGFKYTRIINLMSKLESNSNESDFKEDILTMMSIGSLMGIGIGLLISYFSGSNLLIAIICICIALWSLHKNWVLLIR
jgi:hypothetical protein